MCFTNRQIDNRCKKLADLEAQIKALQAQADEIKNEIKADIKQLTGRIQKLRKQVKICDRILTQEPKVEQDLQVVKDYTEKLKRKEVDRHGNIGRRGRTSR